MIKVYFESSNDGESSNGCYAELVAVFDSEETYMICLPALEAYAKEADMIVTESIDEEKEITDYD